MQQTQKSSKPIPVPRAKIKSRVMQGYEESQQLLGSFPFKSYSKTTQTDHVDSQNQARVVGQQKPKT